MTQPHMPPGWPITHPRRHAGPGPVLAGLMALGASAVVLALAALALWAARNGGNW